MKIFKETVKPGTYKLLKVLMNDPYIANFNLVGGTALSLQTGYRKSIDLDMFYYGGDYDREKLSEYLKAKYSLEPTISVGHTIIGRIEGVKVDFIKAYNTLTEPVIVTEDGIRLVDARDIAAMKLQAIGQSGTRRKDFIDVAFLSVRMSLQEMLDRYCRAYKTDNIIQPLRGLLYFDDITNEESVDLIGYKLDWPAIERRLYRMATQMNKVFDDLPAKRLPGRHPKE